MTALSAQELLHTVRNITPERYLRSLADELRAQSQRVRDLIGDAHWLTDGFHKEFLLAEIIRRHLPGSHIAGRGFVVSPSHLEVRSREQDILVVDTSCEALPWCTTRDLGQ